MQSKSLLIAIAAFAVTATGVQAYNGTILNRADISEHQRSALEHAHELRHNGDREAARDVLLEAGIDEEVLKSLRQAARKVKDEIREAVSAGNYDSFKTLIADTPLDDVITSEADFELFKEAHELREDGEFDQARTIFDGLGIEKRGEGFVHQRSHFYRFKQLSEEQQEAVRVAKEANDYETVKAIFQEAGIERR